MEQGLEDFKGGRLVRAGVVQRRRARNERTHRVERESTTRHESLRKTETRKFGTCERPRRIVEARWAGMIRTSGSDLALAPVTS